MKQAFALLASLRLAVILLVLLLLGLGAGTILESRTDAATAGRLVYYAWWFLALQGLFALNVACSLVDLFPWNRRRIGFALLHASLLLILVGATLTYAFKIEGNLGMWEGDSGSVIVHADSQGRVLSRHQLPFSVKLDDFKLDTYPGTMRPAGFSSQVQITDLDTGRTFPARIWMNNPLHHRGYTLFQSSYQQNDGREASVLSVSKDPGQAVAFTGFFALLAGMIVVISTRIRQARLGERVGTTALMAILALTGMGLKADGDLYQLRRLPVQHDGRVMPLDTLARQTVWEVTGGHRWKGEDPMATYATWLADPQTAAHEANVVLGSRRLEEALDLRGRSHASFLELIQSGKFSELMMAAQKAQMEERKLSPLEDDTLKLQGRLMTMKGTLFHHAVKPFPMQGRPEVPWAAARPAFPRQLVQLLAGPRPAEWPSAKQMDREVFYNRLNPSRLAWVLLAASLLLGLGATGARERLFRGLSLGALAAGFVVMSVGLALRWQVGGRAPAANMYESMLFLGWGVGLFALIAYAFLRNRVVLLNAAAMSALTMALTDLLPMDRFIHPIAPVLSGTPWLAIHVPIIMVGYAVLALSMVVSHMQIAVMARSPRKVEAIDRLAQLNYWYIQVGSLFLVAGILTGSMWAASSWGRYWGWDPKEVWSLVAFLAYMAILHARLENLAGRFWLAVLSVVAFQTILMTYLGVNFVLSTGLHSYGMGDSPVLKWMVVVALAEALFLGWAILMHRRGPVAAKA